MDTYRIENDYLTAEILAYGAIIKHLYLNKEKIPLVVSFPTAEEYKNNPMRIGACIGRYAGRIRNYSIDGKPISITEEEFVLHSGDQGWDKKTWTVIMHQKDRITLQLKCPHNEKGHPGNVTVTLTYTLTDATLALEYHAVTDAPTPINPTQHSYFCFNGSSIEKHHLQIHAKKRLALQENLLPTGFFIENDSTPFFNKRTPIENTNYDDIFIVENSQKPIVSFSSPNGKFKLEVFTNQKCVVIFVSKALNGICFETQGYPDAPNFSHFPSTLLKPGEKYHQKTSYCFSTNTN